VNMNANMSVCTCVCWGGVVCVGERKIVCALGFDLKTRRRHIDALFVCLSGGFISKQGAITSMHFSSTDLFAYE